jgi:hypothetical protein
MGLLLTVSKIYLPGFLRRRKLEMLLAATAEAFQVETPSTRGLPYPDVLELFARFSAEQANKSIQAGSQIQTRERLFLNASRIGKQMRANFNVTTPEEVMRTAELAYRILKIDLEGQPSGEIEIKECFFSAYYSGRVCRMISALDEGILSGLSGGGKLSFSARLTEGSQSCRAFLKREETRK